MNARVRGSMQLAAIALLVVAVVVAPWVRYRVRGGRWISLDAGGYAGLLIAVAAVAAAVSIGELSTRWRWFTYAAVAVGVIAVVLSGLTAATRMAHVNDLMSNVAATTTWGWGTLIALISGAALTALPLLARITSRSSSSSA